MKKKGVDPSVLEGVLSVLVLAFGGIERLWLKEARKGKERGRKASRGCHGVWKREKPFSGKRKNRGEEERCPKGLRKKERKGRPLAGLPKKGMVLRVGCSLLAERRKMREREPNGSCAGGR